MKGETSSSRLENQGSWRRNKETDPQKSGFQSKSTIRKMNRKFRNFGICRHLMRREKVGKYISNVEGRRKIYAMKAKIKELGETR
jgi:hypothetical protein